MKNLNGELEVMNTLGAKPNYAALGRKYGMDWRTVKKYCEGYKGKSKTRNKGSKRSLVASKLKDCMDDKSVSLVTELLDTNDFINLVKDASVQIIF